jgi:hypothetical protein
MTLLSDTELAARLGAIKNGPWAPRSSLAHRVLAIPDADAMKILLTTDRVDLRDYHPADAPRSTIKKLKQTLQAHWIGDGPSEDEQAVRDSFDNALTYFQMIELAIETGYLPQEQVAKDARTRLVRLFWSEAARQYILDYDYMSVADLAARIGVIGLEERRPPPIDPSASVHFAAFLATHRALERDPTCMEWLAFLDDYIVEEDQNDFFEFLEKGQPARTRRRQRLVLGAQTFSVSLADLLVTLPPEHRVRFGAFYAYWFAKLFGFERGPRGYRRNTELWGETDSWAHALGRWLHRVAKETHEGAVQVIRTYDESVVLLREVWVNVRKV